MPPGPTTTIIVNTHEHEIDAKEVSYEGVVGLAFGSIDDDPQITYTVTYRRGRGPKPQGTLTEGETVRIKERMIFDVTRTDQS